jgi:hypothetical protein
MRHTLLHYLSTQILPATVGGARGVATVEALVQDGHVKAVFPAVGSDAAMPPSATVTAFTPLGWRELKRIQIAAPSR